MTIRRRRRKSIKRIVSTVSARSRIRIHTVESLSDFIAFLSDNFDDKDTLLFRGQREDWPLEPKIARLKLRSREDTVLRTERKMREDFELQALAFAIDWEPESDWEWLSLAQHYGMATRLLDWTANSLAALWFAVRKPPIHEGRKDDGWRTAVVWVLEPQENDYVNLSDPKKKKETPFNGTRTRVYRPKHITRRIAAQSGWFTVHKYVSNRKRPFVPLEKQKNFKNSLTKILVPAELFPDLRYDLDRCGVNTASMLPDLSGLSKYMEWYHSLLDDEKAGQPRLHG